MAQVGGHIKKRMNVREKNKINIIKLIVYHTTMCRQKQKNKSRRLGSESQNPHD